MRNKNCPAHAHQLKLSSSSLQSLSAVAKRLFSCSQWKKTFSSQVTKDSIQPTWSDNDWNKNDSWRINKHQIETAASGLYFLFLPRDQVRVECRWNLLPPRPPRPDPPRCSSGRSRASKSTGVVAADGIPRPGEPPRRLTFLFFPFRSFSVLGSLGRLSFESALAASAERRASSSANNNNRRGRTRGPNRWTTHSRHMPDRFHEVISLCIALCISLSLSLSLRVPPCLTSALRRS